VGDTKSTRRLPFEKWWWDVWMSDTGLSKCSVAARGAWHDALGRMWLHDGPDYEISETPEVYGRWWGVTADTVRMLVDELARYGVCEVSAERNGEIGLLSRRRFRTASERKSNAERQKRYRDRQNAQKVTVPVTPLLSKSNGETSDFRLQTSDFREDNTVSSAPSQAKAAEQVKAPVKQCIDAFFLAFKAKHGKPYRVAGKDAAQVKRLLVWLDGQGLGGVETFTAHLDAYLSDDWVVAHKTASLADYCARFNKWLQEDAATSPPPA